MTTWSSNSIRHGRLCGTLAAIRVLCVIGKCNLLFEMVRCDAEDTEDTSNIRVLHSRDDDVVDAVND